MKMNRSIVGVLAATLALNSCGGGGGGSSASFDLLVEPPGGSGLAGTEARGIPFLPVVARDFTLPAGITVTGLVTDGAGAPLGNANVSFLSPSSGRAMGEDSTDASGSYSLTIAAGSWEATADSGDSTLGSMDLNGVSVAAPGPVTVDFHFPAPVLVSGSVFEEFGPAIADAKLSFKGSSTGAEVDVTCDPSGFYSTSLIPDTYEVVVTPAGTSAGTHLKEKFPLVVVSGPLGALDFSLTAGVQVSGTVLGALGMPLLEDTDIEVILPQGSNFFPPDGVTADPADGSYSIGPVPAGRMTFRFEPPRDTGYPFQQLARQIVGPTAQSEDFMLSAGFLLSGTVLRDDGVTSEDKVKVELVPLNGSLAPADDKTDVSGFYETSLFSGTYDVTFTPEVTNLQLPETRRITIAADRTFDVVLTLGALLSGTVTQPGGVVPEPDVRVEIAGVLGASAVTDGNGQYSFLAPAGTHTLSLSAQNGFFEDMALAPVSGVVVVVPGPMTRDIEIVLATTGRTIVSGTVFQADGTTPAIGAEITAIDKTGDVIGRALSGPGGDYILVIP